MQEEILSLSDGIDILRGIKGTTSRRDEVKLTAKLFALILVLVVLSGCRMMTLRPNTKATDISGDAMPELNVRGPVALRNSSSSSEDIVIGKWIGAKVLGNLDEFTESSVGTAKKIFERQNIPIEDDADKVLELSVYDAKAEQGMVKFRATTALRVRTGDGLEKEYVGVQNYGNGHATTPAIERALGKCVVQMLSDPEITDYLEN
jgi:hypothetical protein